MVLSRENEVLPEVCRILLLNFFESVPTAFIAGKVGWGEHQEGALEAVFLHKDAFRIFNTCTEAIASEIQDEQAIF